MGWPSSRRPGSAVSRGSWPRTAARRTCPASAPTAGRRSRSGPSRSSSSGGWKTGTGKAVDLGALLVGVHEDGGLRYAGKIGAGFTTATRAELLAAVAPLAAETSPFAEPPPRAAAKDAHWLRPELVIRAEFAGWTGRRPGAPGRLQGHRAREGPDEGHPRAPQGLGQPGGGSGRASRKRTVSRTSRSALAGPVVDVDALEDQRHPVDLGHDEQAGAAELAVPERSRGSARPAAPTAGRPSCWPGRRRSPSTAR